MSDTVNNNLGQGNYKTKNRITRLIETQKTKVQSSLAIVLHTQIEYKALTAKFDKG